MAPPKNEKGTIIMAIAVGINGFGRIGRVIMRILANREDFEVCGINLRKADLDYMEYMLKYDTVFHGFPGTVEHDEEHLIVNGHKIRVFSETDAAQIPWSECGAEYIIESTGAFNTQEKGAAHFVGGAKKVIITAPAKEEDLTIVMGVNHNDYDPAKHHIVSNASCTTNCLAPVAYVVEKLFGISTGAMTTVHSYTNDQRILDQPHKDLRRARAAACNIIPTSTGAAQAVAKVIPSLKGKFTGWSLRVPTPTVSIVDFTAVLNKPTDTETLRAAIKEAAEGELKGILAYSALPLVSMDFKGNPNSSIVEAEYTTVQDGTLAKIVSWYDNEWGYSNRVADLIMWMKEKGF